MCNCSYCFDPEQWDPDNAIQYWDGLFHCANCETDFILKPAGNEFCDKLRAVGSAPVCPNCKSDDTWSCC